MKRYFYFDPSQTQQPAGRTAFINGFAMCVSVTEGRNEIQRSSATWEHALPGSVQADG